MLYNWCVRLNFERDFLDIFAVEAYMASWIEIPSYFLCSAFIIVEAYMASWIEITVEEGAERQVVRRGLYGLVDWNPYADQVFVSTIGRGLYGLVDWNVSSRSSLR